MEPRLSLEEDTCIRKGLAALLGIDSPDIDRIQDAACAVVRTCEKLTLEEQRLWAVRLFDVLPQSILADAFVLAYQMAESDIAGRGPILPGS